jgi:hypothetical protein
MKMSMRPPTPPLSSRDNMSHHERYPGDSSLRPTVLTDRCPLECGICLEPLTVPFIIMMPTYITRADSEPDSDAEEGERPHFAATIDRCGHVCGRQCLRTWLRLENTCPACQGELYPRVEEPIDGILVLRELNITIDISSLGGPET